MDRIEQFVMYCLRDSATPSRHIESGAVDFSTMFTAFLEVDISGDKKLEVPACFVSSIPQLKKDSYNSIILPITSQTTAIQRRLVRGILADFMNPTILRRCGFAYCKTNSGNYYYGLPGIILDEDKNPLLVMTLELELEKGSEGIEVLPLRVICHVSPKVFLHQDRLIEKAIIKKVIPFCSNKKLDEFDVRNRVCKFNPDIKGTTIKVIIDDINNLVIKPASPKISMITDKEFSSTVINNVKKLLENDFA